MYTRVVKALKTLSFICLHPLAKHQKAKAVQKWLVWQIKSRVSSGKVSVPWIENSVLIVKKGMTGATGNIYCGLHEFHDMALLLHYFCEQPGLFLDIGANVGSYTILASKVGMAKTICVEPVKSTMDALLANIEANRISERVEFHQVVLSEKTGKTWFSSDRDTTNSVVSELYVGQKEMIEVKTVDAILGHRTADFWKIDVEGHEEAVLSGARASLNRPEVKVVLMEGETQAIKQIMISNSFQKAKYDPFTRTVSNLRSGESSSGSNNLWVRNPEKITARCRKARPINIYGQII
jgi:FkbM family methyltransferase